MSQYTAFFAQLEQHKLSRWSALLSQQIPAKLAIDRHGKMAGWQAALAQLPQITPSVIELCDRVSIGQSADLEAYDRNEFIALLKQFHPWRKGPYELFGITIDTEWRSDWKWQRLLPHISPLRGRRVLDVGGGNGYHGWRMEGEGADWVVGIDPTLVFVMQYHLIQHYIASQKHTVLPVGIEQLPEKLHCFDTVFSMGVLYHRRSPLKHLLELRDCLRSGAELVLETLIIDGPEGMTLMPQQRYAKMKNVWFFPSALTMESWLRRCGFKHVRCVDVNVTGLDEQRSTQWMTFESLKDFLDPCDSTKTVEGYPAPKRAIFIAEAP